VARVIRTRTDLPIWWSENFFEGGGWSYQAAGLATIMYHELKVGSRLSMVWGPEGTAGNVDGGNYQNLYSDTRRAGGGRPFPFYSAFLAFHTYFGPGTRLYRTACSAGDVLVLASIDHIMLINQRNANITVRVNGLTLRMHRYGIRLLNN
jgi:hypothetical protein